MASDNLASMSDAQLVQLYVDNVQLWHTIKHVGRANRLMGRRIEIVDELKARSDGTLVLLRPLLDHDNPRVRGGAAHQFKRIDHPAFERTLRALAEREDEIGRDAKKSLEWDAYFQEHGYPEQVTDKPTELRADFPMLHWQADNPPPAALTQTEIEELLLGALPREVGEHLLRLARPAIGLWPQRPPSGMPLAASRLGGMPVAPREWSWPTYETEPMLFLGQINCADLKGFPGAEKLPSSGLLAFFGDHDAVTGCSWPDGSQAAVFHWTDLDRLVPATPPIEVLTVFPLAALAFRPLVDLPDPLSIELEGIFADEDQVMRYSEILEKVRNHGIPEEVDYYCGLSKLLGWPRLVQNELDSMSGSLDGKFRLLLEIGQYTNGTETEGWGPGGSLYFLIRDKDLSERRIERCEFEAQFT